MVEARWINARDAAALVRRDISRVHSWIREDRIRAIRDDDGLLHVRTDEVLELEVRMRNRRNNTTRRRA